MGMAKAKNGEALAAELASLPDLNLQDLKTCWTALYGTTPSGRLGRRLLMFGIAYRLQEQAMGGLRPAAHRKLEKAAANAAAGREMLSDRSIIKPGTRLLRTWNGLTHEVIILEEGVRYRGVTWRSLSAVAREITGARWSGPRFFGLKDKR